MMYETRYKLHPISALINFLKGLKELIVPFVILFGVNLFQGGFTLGWEDLLPVAIGGAALLFILVSGIIKWKRFVYWFEDGELRIEYGLFVKKKRYIPFDRIQSLDYTEGIFHRPLGLVKVKVETAGGKGDGAEAELTAIPREDADRIAQKIEEAKRGIQPEAAISEETGLDQEHPAEERLTAEQPEKNLKVLYRISMKELLVLATTSGGVGVVISGVAVFFSQFSDLIPYDAIYDEVMLFLRFGFLVIALVIFLGLLAAWVVSVVLAVLANYQFTIQTDEENIYITRGLLEKKKVTVPFKRIQAINVVQNPLREWFGYATVNVESAGSSSIEGKEDKIRLFPLVKKDKMLPILQELFPETDWTPELEKAPKRSAPFFYRLDFIWMIPVIGGLSYFFFPYGLFSLLLLPLVLVFAFWQHRTVGFAMTGRQLTMQFRTISKQTYYMRKKRIQAIEVKQNWFQRRRKVASAEATIKSGMLGTVARVEHIEQEDASRILDWFEPSGSRIAQNRTVPEGQEN